MPEVPGERAKYVGGDMRIPRHSLSMAGDSSHMFWVMDVPNSLNLQHMSFS